MGGCCTSAYKTYKLNNAEFTTTPEPLYTFKQAKVVKVYDGDTFWIAAWFDSDIYRFKVRLYGVNCPELNSRDLQEKEIAQQAKQFVIDKILNQIVHIDVLNHTIVNNKKIEEKYGRLLAHIKYKENGKEFDLCQELIKNNLGVPYYGRKT